MPRSQSPTCRSCSARSCGSRGRGSDAATTGPTATARSPAHRGLALLIEISHRYGAAILSTAVIALAVLAITNRSKPDVGGEGGVARASILAAGLVVLAALVGGATVKLGLSPLIVVIHLAIAMSLSPYSRKQFSAPADSGTRGYERRDAANCSRGDDRRRPRRADAGTRSAHRESA